MKSFRFDDCIDKIRPSIARRLFPPCFWNPISNYKFFSHDPLEHIFVRFDSLKEINNLAIFQTLEKIFETLIVSQFTCDSLEI